MNHKTITWGLRFLVLALVAISAGAWAGIIHPDILASVHLGGSGMLMAIPLVGLPDMFTSATLTESINKIPLMPSKIGSSGLFTERGISTRFVMIDEVQGRLTLVPNTSVNDDPVPQKGSSRKRRTFAASHLPVQGVIRPEELQGFTALGSDTIENQQARVINDRLTELKRNIEVTREWQRMGAISGKILDADGTAMIDLFAEYGISKATQNCTFSSATAEIRTQLMAAKRASEKVLGGTLVRGFRAYCAPDWFDALVAHPTVQKAFANYQEAQDRLGGDVRSGFVFAGVEFIEYNASVSSQKFVPDGKAKFFPVADGVFNMYNAPANYNETVNTLGLPFYAKSEEREMNKGWKLEAQANPLALCTYPEALVELGMN